MLLVAAEERTVEEHVTFQVGDITLEGLWWMPPNPPAVGVVLCHPHPLYGGDMYNNVVTALTEALQQAGIMTLRFNFRGVGQSGGTHGEGQAEIEDVQAAVAYLVSRQRVATVAVAGYSFGAMVGLRAASTDDRVHTLIGVALPVGRRDASFLTTARKPLLLISGDRDPISPLAALQELVAKLAEPKQLVTVAGADHFFAGQERDVVQAALAFVQDKQW
jgi:alpha/beta superfamily hydrolase